VFSGDISEVAVRRDLLQWLGWFRPNLNLIPNRPQINFAHRSTSGEVTTKSIVTRLIFLSLCHYYRRNHKSHYHSHSSSRPSARSSSGQHPSSGDFPDALSPAGICRQLPYVIGIKLHRKFVVNVRQTAVYTFCRALSLIPPYHEKVFGFRRISQVVLAVAGGSGPLDPAPRPAPRLGAGDITFHVGFRAHVKIAIGVTSYGALGHVPPLELGHVKKIGSFYDNNKH